MTTFDEFINNDPIQKEEFNKEYQEFLISEFILEEMQNKHISVRKLAEMASVSPTVVQKMRGRGTSNKITYGTLVSVLSALGYRVNIEKISETR